MRQSREAKAETRQAVVAQASRLFRDRGIDGTSVGDIMGAAAKTHGGFYRHFESKEALLLEALDAAFDEQLALLAEGFARDGGADTLARFLAYYLSPERVADAGGGCPVAALAGEARRGGDEVRHVFGSGARRMIETIAGTLDGSESDRMERAARTFSLAVGALMIARASDPATATLLLKAARSSVD